MVFLLPLVMIALQEEYRKLMRGGMGPIGLIICPSRELAGQTFEVAEGLLKTLRHSTGKKMRGMLCIGGTDIKTQCDKIRKGIHISVSTPGRLKVSIIIISNVIKCKIIKKEIIKGFIT